MLFYVVIKGNDSFAVTALTSLTYSFNNALLMFLTGLSPVWMWHLDAIRQVNCVNLQAFTEIRFCCEIHLHMDVQNLLLESLNFLEVAPLLNFIRD